MIGLDDAASDEELFYSTFDCLIAHTESLALPAEACCQSQGNYNVAFELAYIIPSCSEYLLRNPIGVLSELQRQAMKNLLGAIANVPEAARRGTDVAEESVENMRHPGWRGARHEAQRYCSCLHPSAPFGKHFGSARTSWRRSTNPDD